MKKLKENKGITLVALVITIIILLILAVVAINAVNGDGIIGKAKEAGSSYNEKATAENTELARQLGLIENILGVEKVVEGTEITNSNGKAVKVGDLVYYVKDLERHTASVCGYKGDIDYTTENLAILEPIVENENIEILENIKIGEEEFTVIEISDSAFSCMGHGSEKIVQVNIPDTIAHIGIMAFCGCTNLNSLDIPSSVTDIGMSAFSLCASLTDININRTVDSITGSPWGATDSNITWNN